VIADFVSRLAVPLADALPVGYAPRVTGLIARDPIVSPVCSGHASVRGSIRPLKLGSDHDAEAVLREPWNKSNTALFMLLGNQ